MNRRFTLVLMMLMSGGLAGCMEPVFNERVASGVDLARYAGLWYEIASIPSIASAGGRCTNTTAEYTLQDDGSVRLFNQCFLDRADGRALTIGGRARPIDQSNARLAIRFDFSFSDEAYNIIDLDTENYQWAVVGSGADGLFILSRTTTLDPTIYAGILARLPGLGYDPARLLLTPQTPR